MSAQAPRQESLFPETLQGGYYPVLEGGYAIPIRRRAGFLLQALEDVSGTRSRTGLDDGLEHPHIRRDVTARYPGEDIDGHIRHGAKRNRAPLMRSYKDAFHGAYGERGEALAAATANMNARERAEFDIDLQEMEESSNHFRHVHFAKKGTVDTKSPRYAREKIEKQKARDLLRKRLNAQLATLPVDEAVDQRAAA